MTRKQCGCPAHPPDWRGDLDLGGMLVHEMPVPMFLHMPIGLEAMRERQLADIARIVSLRRVMGPLCSTART